MTRSIAFVCTFTDTSDPRHLGTSARHFGTEAVRPKCRDISLSPDSSALVPKCPATAPTVEPVSLKAVGLSQDATTVYQKSLNKKGGEVRPCGFQLCEWTDRRTNKQTYSSQSILQKAQ